MAGYDQKEGSGAEYEPGWYKPEGKSGWPYEDVSGEPDTPAEQPKTFDNEQLADSEGKAGAVTGAVVGGAAAALGPEAEAASFVFKNNRKKLNLKGLLKSKKALAAGGGGGGLIVLAVLLFLLLGQLKVISFGQVVTTTVYARFGTMLKERWANDFLDRAVVEGEGSIAMKSTFFDRFRLKDPNTRLTELGREGNLKYEFKNGRIDKFQIGQESVSLDGIVKDLGLGPDYESINPKGPARYSPKNIEARAAAKKLFTDNVNELRASEVLAEESGVVRSRAFGYMADQVGFKFSRWRQKGREFLGRDVLTSQQEDTANNATEIAPEEPTLSDVPEVDQFLKDTKKPDTIKKFVAKNEGKADIQKKMIASFEADLAKTTKIQESAATVGKVTLAASLACMVNIAARKTQAVRAENYKHAMDNSMRLTAAAHQAEIGDVTSEVYGVEASNLDGGEAAPSYQYAQGLDTIEFPKDFDRPKVDSGLNGKIVSAAEAFTNPIGKYSIVAAIANFTGIGQGVIDSVNSNLCAALLSPQGALVAVSAEFIVQAITAVFTDGSATAISEGGADAFIQLLITGLWGGLKGTVVGLAKSLPALVGVGLFGLGLELLSRYLSHSDFTGLSTGPDRVEQYFAGGQLAQDNQMRTMMGGVPLKNHEELKAVDLDAQLAVRGSYKNQSFFARTFSPKNPFSLATMAAVRTPTSLTSAASMAQRWLGRIGSTFTNPLQSLSGVFISRASAQAASDFDPHEGIETAWGWTQDELDVLRTDDSYGIVGNAAFFSKENVDPETDPMFTEYAKCFNPEISQYEANKPSELGIGASFADKCRDHPKLDDEFAFRYRVYVMDKFIVSQQDQSFKNEPHDLNGGGATTAAAPAPAPAPVTGGPGVGSGVTGPCAPGTTDLGIPTDPAKSVYLGGKPVPARLCGLPGFKSTSSESQPGSPYYVQGANGNAIVNADASYKFFPLFTAAQAAGIPMSSASSFRTMAHQQSLFAGNPNPARVARPGTSNHQGGQAIDFACSGSTVRTGDKCYVWLSQNAGTFGIKNYPAESWHWSTTGR